jgi:hypothetical protein
VLISTSIQKQLIKKIFHPALLLILFFSKSVAQSNGGKVFSKIPQDSFGALVQYTIRTINSNNADTVSHYILKTFATEYLGRVPLADQVRKIMTLGKRTGGVNFVSLTYLDASNKTFELSLQDKIFELGHSLSLRIDEQGKIDRWLNSSVPKALTRRAGARSEANTIKDIRSRLDKAAQQDAFSGIAYIAKGDKVLFAKAYGMAAKAYGFPNNVNTKFSAASLNKMFTAIAIGQLQEQGKLSFHDTIGKWIDSTWMADPHRNKITIQQLLIHRSGLGTYFYDPTYKPTSGKNFRLNSEKAYVKRDMPEFEPGTKFRYSNTGYFLLGVIIEKIIGTSYYDYIQKHIYAPAGMTHTGSFSIAENVPNLAFGYTYAPLEPFHWDVSVSAGKGSPAGEVM